jgi:hypothetical protein
MRGQSYLLLETEISGVQTRCDKILNPLERKNPDASYIEINPDQLRSLVTDYLDNKKSVSQSWKKSS